MTADQARKLLRQKQGAGTQRELAARIGIAESFLSDIYSGNRNPSGKVLKFLGLRKAVEYR